MDLEIVVYVRTRTYACNIRSFAYKRIFLGV